MGFVVQYFVFFHLKNKNCTNIIIPEKDEHTIFPNLLSKSKP